MILIKENFFLGFSSEVVNQPLTMLTHYSVFSYVPIAALYSPSTIPVRSFDDHNQNRNNWQNNITVGK